jgi:hypothetical protein
LSRFNWNRKILAKTEFFYTDNLDYTGVGCTKTASLTPQPAYCGVPITFSAKTAQDLKCLLPNGVNFLSSQIDWNQMHKSNQNFEDVLLWSPSAKAFAVARELASLERLTIAYHSLVDTAVIAIAFFSVYWNNRKKKPKYIFNSKTLTYSSAALSAVAAIILLRIYDKSLEEKYKDNKACDLGLDMCEGAIDYYQRMKERNLAFRQILPDGKDLIDEYGNLKYFVFKVPFINKCVRIKSINEKLDSRKEFCKLKLISTIANFANKSNETKTVLASKQTIKTEKSDGNTNELDFFKQIRLNLENSKAQKNENKFK